MTDENLNLKSITDLVHSMQNTNTRSLASALEQIERNFKQYPAQIEQTILNNTLKLNSSIESKLISTAALQNTLAQNATVKFHKVLEQLRSWENGTNALLKRAQNVIQFHDLSALSRNLERMTTERISSLVNHSLTVQNNITKSINLLASKSTDIIGRDVLESFIRNDYRNIEEKVQKLVDALRTVSKSYSEDDRDAIDDFTSKVESMTTNLEENRSELAEINSEYSPDNRAYRSILTIIETFKNSNPKIYNLLAFALCFIIEQSCSYMFHKLLSAVDQYVCSTDSDSLNQQDYKNISKTISMVENQIDPNHIGGWRFCVISVSHAHIFEAPKKKSKVIGGLFGGEFGRVVDRRKKWVCIEILKDGDVVTGWVKSKYIRYTR